ncbi:MAG: tRNA uridine(34) 5-carboxymethylaminomethyl modification radical SAM/GNAT enzyme Elp3 [Candidatus Pacebacteria bacterium]|nr:tRNA uridine(34) 5-carboxymethylaminomethyl modification radical SAM/GNAT enzyme Elp3 [Candidatus Paceibacterota bacterium]
MRPEEILILRLVRHRWPNKQILEKLKRKISAEFSIDFLPNSLLLKAYHKLVEEKRIKENKKIEEILKIKKIRSLSGIVIVSVLTKPYPCPGKCLYCPEQKDIPKSYVKGEPAVDRAVMLKYHPYLQVKARLKTLEEIGHPVDKIDLRIIGGTWSAYPKRYQTWFIKECFRAASEYPSPSKRGRIKEGVGILKKLQRINEKAKCRIIGITIETRPDFVDVEEIKRLRKLGITRVELGVQSIYDDVLDLSLRGHKVKETIQATKLLKDAGFKICYQMMPNLYGSNLKRDLEMFKELFQNPDFCPDYLKIYPCALLKEAPLYKIYKEGKYRPYSFEELLWLLKEIKKIIPFWVRIQRIMRDIPSQNIIEGPTKISNLRQIIQKDVEKEGWRCRCIRCREVRENYNPKEKVYLFRQNYWASDGYEIFLSFENKKRTKLFSLLRLRIPSQYFTREKHYLSVLENSAIIREIHTYGRLIGVGKRDGVAPQHKGLGKKLIKEAERITKEEFRLNKITVIAGVGVRDYFRKFGYRLKDTYMVKCF